jgi:molybdopterin-binding protein
MTNDLMQKLAISKKIMDVQNNIPRGNSAGLPMSESITNASYNIPQEYVSQPEPMVQQKSPANIGGPISEEKIMGSKLPEDIKRLMLENPIVQPNMGGGPVLSDEIIEGAARLMGKTPKSQVSESAPQIQNSSFNNNDLKQMIRDVVRDTVRDVVREELQNSGVITESKLSNESLQLRVGSHIFEGKVTKIKKLK